MAHFLSVDADARVLMIAGFHTGRPKVASFFDGIGRVGLEIDTIWETDSNGERRAWDPKRPQGPGEDKRWLVVAALKRKCEEYEAKEVDHL
jgi:EEF1A N-terminal glycine/lysine methyltransferase